MKWNKYKNLQLVMKINTIKISLKFLIVILSTHTIVQCKVCQHWKLTFNSISTRSRKRKI